MFRKEREQALIADSDWQAGLPRRIEQLRSRIYGITSCRDSGVLEDSRDSGRTGYVTDWGTMRYAPDGETNIYFSTHDNPFGQIVKHQVIGLLAVNKHTDPRTIGIVNVLPKEERQKVLTFYLTGRNGETRKVVANPRWLIPPAATVLIANLDQQPSVSVPFSPMIPYPGQYSHWQFYEAPFVSEQDLPIMREAYQMLEARLDRPLKDRRTTLRRSVSAFVHRLPHAA